MRPLVTRQCVDVADSRHLKNKTLPIPMLEEHRLQLESLWIEAEIVLSLGDVLLKMGSGCHRYPVPENSATVLVTTTTFCGGTWSADHGQRLYLKSGSNACFWGFFRYAHRARCLQDLALLRWDLFALSVIVDLGRTQMSGTKVGLPTNTSTNGTNFVYY